MNELQKILANVKKTNYGLSFIPITKEEWAKILPCIEGTNWTKYDIAQVGIHFKNANGKYAFLDAEYYTPIDNEYDLDELYQMEERGEI